MSTIRRACGLTAAILFSLAGTSCREPAAPTGLGRVAPTRAALAFSSVLPEASGEPVIPLRSARVRLFRLPGQTPERAVVDTVVPFRETDADVALTLGVVVTMVSERFGLELSLIDDQQQVVYLARDTVVSYTSGQAPPRSPVVLRYVGPDTAVARIALGIDEDAIPVGESTPLRVSAFRRDGRPTSARFGFAVRGSPAVTIDDAGLLRATAPVAKGSTWIVARIATGLADSIAVEAIVPAAGIALSAASARIDVGDHLALDAVVRDASGAILPERRPTWVSSDERVATVVDGVVTGHARGVVAITARSGRARAEAAITVGPAGVARVAIAPHSLSMVVADVASLTATAYDADGIVLTGRAASWSSVDPAIASVDGTGRVRALAGGVTQIVATVEGVADTITMLSRVPATLRITRTGTTFDARGEVASFVVWSYDQQGVLIDTPSAQWSVTTGATLLSFTGSRTDLVLQPGATVVLTAQARGLRADLPVAAATPAPPAPPPSPTPPPVPPTPPKRG